MKKSKYILKEKITTGKWITVFLCVAVIAAWVFQNFIFAEFTRPSSPVWLPPVAAMLGALGIMQISSGQERLSKVLLMTGLLLMVWAASKVLFDFLTMAGTIGDPVTGEKAKVDWPGTISRVTAFAAAVALALNALKTPAAGSKPPASWYGYAAFVLALPYPAFAAAVALALNALKTPAAGSKPPASWYGYAAFVLALPYPLLRIIWAIGGTPGITYPGAAGEGFKPLIIAIPWMLAAALSLLLVTPRRWKPRFLLLFAGWSATAIVASIGPAAFFSMITMLFTGEGQVKGDISAWVFWLFYTSWFLWSIAGFATTRSYQIRSATLPA